MTNTSIPGSLDASDTTDPEDKALGSDGDGGDSESLLLKGKGGKPVNKFICTGCAQMVDLTEKQAVKQNFCPKCSAPLRQATADEVKKGESEQDPQVILGQIQEGNEYGATLSIPLSAFLRHALFIGSSGSGKTVGIKAAAEGALLKQVPVVAFDVMGDLTGLALPLGSPKEYTEWGFQPPSASQEKWAFAQFFAKKLRKKSVGRILTLFDDSVDRIAIPMLANRPEDYETAQEDEIIVQGECTAIAVIQRLNGSGAKIQKLQNEIAFITEVVLDCWERDLELSGIEGLANFLEVLSQHEPTSFFNQKQKDALVAKLERQTSGTEKLLFKGHPLNWDQILAQSVDGRTPFVSIALNHIAIEQRPWIIGQVLNSLMSWANKKGPSPHRPRVMVLIDELAGDGGASDNALLPPANIKNHPSGNAIRRVLRQGRHSGVSLVVGTQNAGDLDYKSYSNFEITVVGCQKSKTDIDRVLEGVGLSGDVRKRIESGLPSVTMGKLYVFRKSHRYHLTSFRWIAGAHTKISVKEHPAVIEQMYKRKYCERLQRVPTVSNNEKVALGLKAVLTRHSDTIGRETREEMERIITRKSNKGHPPTIDK